MDCVSTEPEAHKIPGTETTNPILRIHRSNIKTSITPLSMWGNVFHTEKANHEPLPVKSKRHNFILNRHKYVDKTKK